MWQAHLNGLVRDGPGEKQRLRGSGSGPCGCLGRRVPSRVNRKSVICLVVGGAIGPEVRVEVVGR